MLRPYEDMILDLQSFSWSSIQHPSTVEKSAFFNHGISSGLKKNSMIVGPRKGVIWIYQIFWKSLYFLSFHFRYLDFYNKKMK